MRKISYRLFLAALLSSFILPDIAAQNIVIEISGIRSEAGQFIIDVYKDSESFKNEKPFQRKVFQKSRVSDGMMTVSMELGKGTYGFALVDDENNNMEMDFRKIGLTKEGFAFSDYYLEGFKRPEFSDFKFDVEGNQIRKIRMEIRYM